MPENLKPYPAYKDSGVPWLGQVPEHWKLRSLGSITTSVSHHGRPDLALLSVVRERGVIPRSSMSDEENHNFIPDDLTGYKVVRKGNLVVNKMKAWQGSLGIAPMDGVVSPAYFVFEIQIGDGDFAQALLRSKAYIPFFAQASDGVRIGQWELSPVAMKRIPVILPPKPEQDAIVRYLDHADRKVRHAIRARQRLIALLNEQKQAIIQRAVTRGLDPNVRLKPSGVPWLGEVPEPWGIERLKSLMSNVTQQAGGRHSNDLYVALENVESWTGCLKEPSPDVSFDSQVKRFQSGDVLFGKLRPYLAKVARPMSGGVCVGEFLVLRPRVPNATSAYMEQLLRSKPIIDAVDSSTFGAKMPRANWQFMGGMAIPLPPVDEQDTIVRYLDDATAKLNEAIRAAHCEIDLLREYRTRLIADVVTGKLDVRDAAANLPDEPEMPPEPCDEEPAEDAPDLESEGSDGEASEDESRDA